MDPKGNLYLHKTAFLCKNEIVKQLVNNKYQLVESNLIGESRWFALKCYVTTQDSFSNRIRPENFQVNRTELFHASVTPTM